MEGTNILSMICFDDKVIFSGYCDWIQILQIRISSEKGEPEIKTTSKGFSKIQKPKPNLFLEPVHVIEKCCFSEKLGVPVIS